MRLLVVEDEPDLLRAVWSYLTDDGYAVDMAADGVEGLSKAKSWDYDAIVLDVMMPRMDGWTVLSQLRQFKKTPVLMLTARDSVSDRIKGLDSGADDYLVKPFEMDELSARIRALIRRAANTPKPVVEIGDVKVDLSGKTVTKGGEPANLTATEYSLVEFLVLHRGQLVTRPMLYNHLFDEFEDSMSNLLDVHVSNVRRKLGKDFITTRRGLGYLIEDAGAPAVT
jgi:two-component system OmpR family response regulator